VRSFCVVFVQFLTINSWGVEYQARKDCGYPRPLWVKSRHVRRKTSCLLYPRSGHTCGATDAATKGATIRKIADEAFAAFNSGGRHVVPFSTRSSLQPE
jgi:hypothetical protein